MQVCTSCNIEYEDDKKFCNYCGGPLKPKTESISAPKKVNRADDEKSEGKLFCPRCKITYEFGSSCIQCGSPLGRQTSSQENEGPEIPRGTQTQENLPPAETSQEQASGATQSSGEPEIASGSEAEGSRLQVQTIEEQLVVETPRKKLICPSCKIIYERGTSCVRCGAALVPQTSSKEKEKPKPTVPELDLSPSEPDGLEDAFLPVGSTNLSTTSGPGPGAAPGQPPPPGPKAQDPIPTEQRKRKEPRFTSPLEAEFEEEYPQARASEQPIVKKSADDLLKSINFLSKFKKDYRRLGIEVGSIMIMIFAGGYLLWQVFSYMTKPKPPESGKPPSKEVAIQIPPSSSSSSPPAATAAESGESKNTAAASSIPKEAPPAPASLPEPSKSPSAENQEVGNIKTLLEKVRQSNLKKDIDLFVSCYASDFENMEGRKRATIAYWDKFNYLDLSYDVRNLSVSVETAKAKIEWLIKTSLKGGGQYQENKSVLDVAFKKEDGKWKIKEVKPTR